MTLLVKQCRVNMNTIHPSNSTALHSMTRSGASATIQVLLDAGADNSIANMANNTAMHIAVLWKSLNALDELIKSGADFSQLNLAEESPLHTVA